MSGIQASFDNAQSVRRQPNTLNAQAIKKLEKKLNQLRDVIVGNGQRLDVFRWGEAVVNDHIAKEGSYHLTQPYVLAYSASNNDRYHSVLVLRHSMGFLNSDEPNQTGRPYQSISVFDTQNYTRTSLSGGDFSDAVQILSNIGAEDEELKVVATPHYASFPGDFNKPEQLIDRCLGLLGSLYGHYPPERKHVFGGLSKNNLDKHLVKVINEGGNGVMLGDFVVSVPTLKQLPHTLPVCSILPAFLRRRAAS